MRHPARWAFLTGGGAFLIFGATLGFPATNQEYLHAVQTSTILGIFCAYCLRQWTQAQRPVANVYQRLSGAQPPTNLSAHQPGLR